MNSKRIEQKLYNKIPLSRWNSTRLWFRVEDSRDGYPLAPFVITKAKCKLSTRHGWISVTNLQQISPFEPRQKILKSQTDLLVKFNRDSYEHSAWYICRSPTKARVCPRITTSFLEILVLQSLPQLKDPRLFGFIFDFLLSDSGFVS